MWTSVLIAFLLSFITAGSIPLIDPANRIVNGQEVDIQKISYQAALRRRVSISGWSHTCGAVIVRHKAVLTAAHCVSTYQNHPSSLCIVVGTSYRLSGGTTYDIDEVVVHHAYSSDTLINDIAILVTTSNIRYGRYVSPVNIAPTNFIIPEGTEAIVSGYGTIEYEGSVSSTLRMAHVYTVNQAACSRAYFGIASVSDEMLCACASDPARDACQGDSGGPLVANGTLIGIVSWGEGCADPNYPGVYTRVSAYNDWIREQLSSR